MRMGWKDAGPGFALAVGGLHPRFTAPAGFPSVARLQLALTNGDNPKLICQAYFAVTSNTVQFGADCSLVRRRVRLQHHRRHRLRRADPAAAVPLPRRVPRERAAQARQHQPVQGLRQRRARGPAAAAGRRARPPSRSSGATSRSRSTPRSSTGVRRTTSCPIDVLSVLVDALSAAAVLAGAAARRCQRQLVSLRQPVTEGVLLHPLGSLTVRQNVVPLGLTRDIDRVGTATPSGDRTFAVTARGARRPGTRSRRQRPGAVRARPVLRPERRRPAGRAVVRVDGRGRHVRRRRLHDGYAAGLALRLHRHHRSTRTASRCLEPDPHRPGARARPAPARAPPPGARPGAPSTSGSRRR